MVRMAGMLFIGGAALLLSAPPLGAAGPKDPAAIPAEVIQRVVPKRKPRATVAERLERHVEAAEALLERAEDEDRRSGGRDDDRPAYGAGGSPLAARLRDLRRERAEFDSEVAAIRARVAPGQRQAWDSEVAAIERRLEGMTRSLDHVDRASTRGERRQAVRASRAEIGAQREARRKREQQAWGESRTYELRPNLWHEPRRATAPAPRYAQWTPPRPLLAFSGQTLIDADETLLAQAPPAEAASCGYSAADLAATEEVQLTQEIIDLAASLGGSPVKIYQWVANEIAYQPYYGSLKGAAATLSSRAGNATDQASLLIALLRASNVPARYVQGTVEMSDERLQRWVGAKSLIGAAGILNQGLVPTLRLRNAANEVVGVRFTHVWVQACVPYGNYRGTAVDLSGHRWIPLDPSFKDKSYQAGIATAVDFDYATYLATRTHVLPHEKYAEQVETYIKSQPPNQANNTLEDVPYKGRVVPRTIDVLPSSLPYPVIGFTAWDTGLTAETASLPARHRYRLAIEVRNTGGTLLAPSVSLSMPDVVEKRLTLSFQGATAGDQSTIDTWRADPNVEAALPCSANVVPVVKVEGAAVSTGTGAVGICTTNNKLSLRIFLDEITLGTPSGDVNHANFEAIQASDYHALLAYAFQASDAYLAKRATRLLASVQANSNPNADPEEVEGEFLHLVGMKYMRVKSDGTRRVGELDGSSGENGNHLGLTSSRMKVGYVFDRPFAITRAGFLVDVPGGQSRSIDITTGEPVWKTFLLGGYITSAYESWIWQENAQLDAICTVRGIQFARETGIEVLTITSANASTELPKLTSNSNSALNYSAAQVNQIQNLVNSGHTITAPRSLVQYESWKGAVYVSEKIDTVTGGMSAGFIIAGGYAGGYTVIAHHDIVLWEDPFNGWERVFNIVTQRVEWRLDPWEDFWDSWYDDPYQFPTPPPIEVPAAPPIVNSTVNLGPPPTPAGDPVNMVTGNMYHVERDLAIKGRGLPLVFERTYNSLGIEGGPLGFGWTHTFNHSLAFGDPRVDGTGGSWNSDGLTSSVTWRDGSGALRFIGVNGDSSGVAIGATFVPPQGFYFQMARQADGTYTIREKNGLTYTFESVAGTVDQTAKLTRITDRNGNALRLAYNGSNLATVTDDLNRALTFTYDGSNRITELRDWTNRRHEYVYDSNGDLTTYRNPLAIAGTQSPVTYTYLNQPPLRHFMQRYTLPRGNGMTFEYYPNGRVFRHTNTLGESQTFSFNNIRAESLSVNERGLARQYLFDTRGNLVKAVEEGGGNQVYTYDPANPFNRVSARDPMGRSTGYQYDASGNVTRVTLPSGNTIESSHFNAFAQPGKVKDARGNYTINKYDAKGNLLQVIKLRSGVGAAVDPATYTPAAADVVGWTIKTYDTYGNVLTSKQVRDAASQAGPALEYDYNDTVNTVQGLNAVAVTRRGDKNGDGAIDGAELDNATLGYDALGRVTTGLRPDWYATQAVYDAVDRVTRATDAVGQLRDLAYDANGNVLRESLTVGGTLWDERKYGYDMSDRRISAADAAGHIAQYRYDAAGNVTATTSPDGYQTRLEYDANNRVVAAFDEEGHSVRRSLDLAGQPRSVTDPNGGTLSFEYYDSTRDGRLKLRRDAAGRATQFDYDAHGNVTVATDNLGRTTLTTYDELDRPVRVVDPAYADATLGTIRPVTRYSYDLLGHLTSVAAGRTDATGTSPASDVVATQMTYTWDDFGRKLSETDALGRVKRWTYDVHGNPVTVTDAKLQVTQFAWDYGHLPATRQDHAGATTTWTRNPLGLVTQVVSPAVTYTSTYDRAHRLATRTDSRGGVTLTYRWSPAGRPISYEDSHGNRNDYAYDRSGRLNGIWSPKGDLVSFVYDAGGRLTDKWFPNGVTTQYTWNADNSLAKLVNRYRDAGIFSQHEYTYDEVGNRATHAEALAPGLITPYRYVYDPLNRLVEVRNNATSALIEAYSYDALGNRLTKTSGGAVTAYVYDAANQLVEWRSGTSSGPLLGAHVLDASGNVVRKCEGGTVTVSPTDCTGNTVTALTYNALNQLSDVTRTGLSAQSYAYDEQGRRIRKSSGAASANYLYSGDDIVSVYASSMAVPPAGVLTHGPAVDDPLIWVQASNSRYYHQDGLGSVVEFSNGDGTLSATAQYDAWGVRLAALIGSLPVYGYTGREPDETGLVYYRARYYDPALGRFTQRDPIGLAGGLNQYAYVGNNPINFTDPTGLSAAPTGSAFGGGGIGGVKGSSGSGAESTFFDPGTTANSGSQNLGSFANTQPSAGGGASMQVAGGPLLPLLGLGLLFNEIATSDVPMIGGGVAKGTAKLVDDFAVRFHHPYPQYLGGRFQQLLEPLPKALHDTYHSGLDKVLPRQIKGGATEFYSSLSAAEKAANLKKFETYTKEFDRLNGTNLWEGAVREGVLKR
jgi:RHS repeat-associated protein